MAFIFDWIFGKPKEEKSKKDFLDNDVGALIPSGLAVYMQNIAYWSCVRMIASTISAVEWETFSKKKKVKNKEYWLWNYRPNPNQTATDLFTAVVEQLYKKREAVIVETAQGYRYVAESYSVNKKLSGDIYSGITTYSGISVPGTFAASDLIIFRLNTGDVRSQLAGFSAEEGQLLSSAFTHYKNSNGNKGILHINAVAEADADFDETYDDLMNNKFKKFYTSENAVMPLFEGYEYEDTSKGTTANTTTRDIRAMMDDILEITAQAFGIPPSLALGKSPTKEDFNTYMTTLIKPIVQMMSREINSKLFTMKQVETDETKIVPSLANVRYKDLFDIAEQIDKLIGSGAYCVNDIRIRNNDSVINEDWAWQHWMTKNYAPAGDLVDGVQDGKPAGNPRADPDNVTGQEGE